MDADFCFEALQEAIGKYSCPSIFNTDQGSQITSAVWIDELKTNNIGISMDGKGRWMDNVFIERLWRSVKYEEIYLFEHATVIELCAGLEKWFDRYNTWRPHAAMENETPASIYAPMVAIKSTLTHQEMNQKKVA